MINRIEDIFGLYWHECGSTVPRSMMNTENRVFTIEEMRPIRDGMTISRDAKMGNAARVTWFSLGAGTSISAESYDHPMVYIGGAGITVFSVKPEGSTGFTDLPIGPEEILFVPAGELCGMRTENGSVYTELNSKEELKMNSSVKTNEIFALRDLIGYEEGSIANMDIVSNDTMKYVLMAFDEGTGLTPHRAPGNAIVFALEGKAVIGYEGKDYELTEGQCFRFEKNGLHSVTAKGRFKMALLLVLE